MKVLVIGTTDIEFDDFFDFFKNENFLDLYFSTFIPDDISDFSVICNLDSSKHNQIEFIQDIPIICLYEIVNANDNIICIKEPMFFDELKKMLYHLKEVNTKLNGNIEVCEPKILQNVCWIKVDQEKLYKVEFLLNRYIKNNQIKEDIAKKIQLLIVEIISKIKNNILKAKVRIDQKYVDLYVDGYIDSSSYFLNRFADTVQIDNNSMIISWVN